MEEDRISELPDPVLERILCLVTLKEAVQTSLLSKRWRRMNVYSILSSMNFTHSYFYSQVKQKNARKKNRRLLRIVDKIMLARSQSNLSLRELSVDLLWTDAGMKKSSLQLKIERWIGYLRKSDLTTLVFRMGSFDDDEGFYDLSLSMLAAAAQSLQNLFLVGFLLTTLSSCDNTVGFSSLRSLKLWTVRVADEGMQQLLKGCPSLEILELDGIFGLKRLEVKGFSHLKMLVAKCVDLEILHIDVANLEVLELRLPDYIMNLVTCAPHLRQFEFKVSIYELDLKLQLQGLHMPMDKWLSHFLCVCSLLEHLTLDACPTLEKFHLSTPFLALKTLHLQGLRHMTSFKIVAPNLEKLLIDVNRIMPFVEVDAASDKLEVEIIFSDVGQLDDLWYDRLAKSLGFFNHCRAVKFSTFHGNKGSFIPKEKRVMLHSPLYNTYYLELSLIQLGRNLFSEYLDYMLWLSPRATNITIREDDEYCDNNTEIVLEFLYEEENFITLAASSNCSCCKLLLPLKCWRHNLKEVQIRKFVGNEDDKAAIKQFLWEEIENIGITETSLNPDSIYGGQYESYDQLFK